MRGKNGYLKRRFPIRENWRKPEIWKHMQYCKPQEYVIVLAVGSLAALGLGKLFYDSWLAGILLLPWNIWLLKQYEAAKFRMIERRFLDEFRELMCVLTANLRAGYSVENAWKRAEKDIQNIYPSGSRMQKEIAEILGKMSVNIPIEQAVSEFAVKSGQEDILNFAEALCIAKRSGGNLVQIMESTAVSIAEKIETEQEIQVMLSGKKMEQRVMSAMPVFMLLYLRITDPGYLDVMYHNLLGIMIMTGCMAGTICVAWWGNRIMRIEV